MIIGSEYGDEIFCLPDCAKCTLTGKHPTKMEKCPIYNFDDEGDFCVPSCCEHYKEDIEKGEQIGE